MYEVETTVLALDLGTQMGWALHQHGLVNSGVWSFSVSRHMSHEMRFIKFEKTLEEVYAATGDLAEVYYEEVRAHRGVDASHIYGGFLAVLTMWCGKHGIPYMGVPVGTIKKHATGKGNASKEGMVVAAIENGWQPKDDNEADALWLLDLVLKGGV